MKFLMSTLFFLSLVGCASTGQHDERHAQMHQEILENQKILLQENQQLRQIVDDLLLQISNHLNQMSKIKTEDITDDALATPLVPKAEESADGKILTNEEAVTAIKSEEVLPVVPSIPAAQEVEGTSSSEVK